MNPSEAARHLRRLERKLDELRDELTAMREQLDAEPKPEPKGKKRDDPDAEFET